ncbi:hypothetical protein RUM44_006580 [Polyplax serrata]|uniref:Uncharacterized protein n=1 Tax=Polyplax serrata TaxID=468196 RepID=A0ABR1AIJ4_POLSC
MGCHDGDGKFRPAVYDVPVVSISLSSHHFRFPVFDSIYGGKCKVPGRDNANFAPAEGGRVGEERGSRQKFEVAVNVSLRVDEFFPVVGTVPPGENAAEVTRREGRVW